MGAGYKTARPVFVDDKMLKLPWQLMGDVIMKKDQAIDGMHAKATALNEQININAIAADKQQAAQLARQYEDQVNNVSDEIWQNPLEFQNHIGKLRNISKTMSNDMEAGQWAALEDRYTSRTASMKASQEALKKEGYTDEYIQKKLAQEEANAGVLKYDPETGDYNKYSALELTTMPNTNEWVDKVLSNAAPEGSDISYDELKGGWIITTGTKVERMGEEELARILNNSLQGDPEMIASIKQRSELGVSGFSDVLGEDGNLLDPSYMATYDVEDKNGQKTTRQALTFRDNFLGNAAKAGAEKYGFLKTTEETSRVVNPYAMLNAKDQLQKANKREEENKNRDQTVMTFSDTVLSPAGPDHDTFVQTANETAASVAASKKEALNTYAKFMSNLGTDFDITNEEHPAYKAIMEDGDFSVLEDAGVASYEINKLQSAHDKNLMTNSTLTGYKQTYLNNVEHEYEQARLRGDTTADFTTWGVDNGYLKGEKDGKPQVDENQFSNFLSKSYDNTVTRKATWEWTGMTQKAIDNTKDDFESSYEMLPLNIPKFGVTTINKLVESGVATSEQVKVPYQKGLSTDERSNVDQYNRLLATYPSDLTEQVKYDSQIENLEKLPYIKKPNTVSYKIKSGDGYINLQIDPKSLIPVAGMTTTNGKKQVEMKFKMSIDGTPIMGSVDTDHFSTTTIDNIKNINAGDMSIKLWLEQNAHANNMEVPNSDLIIDAKDGFIRSKSTGGKYEIYDENGNVTSQARTLLLTEVAPKI